MKRIWAGLTILIAIALVASTAYAGRGRGPGDGTGRHARQMDRIYDANTVETIQGEVTAVDTRTGSHGGYQGIHLMLKTESETVPVHLGPEWYMKDQPLQVKVGDQITVKGSRVTYEEKPAVIAAEVTRGSEILKLRASDGRPNWAGQARAHGRNKRAY